MISRQSTVAVGSTFILLLGTLLVNLFSCSSDTKTSIDRKKDDWNNRIEKLNNSKEVSTDTTEVTVCGELNFYSSCAPEQSLDSVLVASVTDSKAWMQKHGNNVDCIRQVLRGLAFYSCEKADSNFLNDTSYIYLNAINALLNHANVKNIAVFTDYIQPIFLYFPKRTLHFLASKKTSTTNYQKILINYYAAHSKREVVNGKLYRNSLDLIIAHTADSLNSKAKIILFEIRAAVDSLKSEKDQLSYIDDCGYSFTTALDSILDYAEVWMHNNGPRDNCMLTVLDSIRRKTIKSDNPEIYLVGLDSISHHADGYVSEYLDDVIADVFYVNTKPMLHYLLTQTSDNDLRNHLEYGLSWRDGVTIQDDQKNTNYPNRDSLLTDKNLKLYNQAERTLLLQLFATADTLAKEI